MLTEQKLRDFMIQLTGIDDFKLELVPKYSKTYWGRYFVWRKLIRLYALDENGKQYPDDILIREALHELAHHIQNHHISRCSKKPITIHDEQFHEIHKALLDKAFGRNVPVKYSPVVEKIVASRK